MSGLREQELKITEHESEPGESPIAFEDFYKLNWDRVRRTLSVVLGDPDLATEATDEAMTRVFERWDRVRKTDNPSGWTYRVALNWAKPQIRRRSYNRAVKGENWTPRATDRPENILQKFSCGPGFSLCVHDG